MAYIERQGRLAANQENRKSFGQSLAFVSFQQTSALACQCFRLYEPKRGRWSHSTKLEMHLMS